MTDLIGLLTMQIKWFDTAKFTLTSASCNLIHRTEKGSYAPEN